MKNFRSSKNLRAIDPPNKQQSALRMKVRTLEEQVQLLQKSNLNIFIPLSEHEVKNTPNYQAIISKLKTQILTLQQEVQRQKATIKKMENQKEMMKISHQNEIKTLQATIDQLNEEKQALTEQIDNLDELLDKEKQAKSELQKSNIQLKVENRFLVDDLVNSKKRLEAAQKKYEDLHSQVLSVKFYSRIYNSKKIKVTAIETEQLSNLKAYIDQLQAKLRELLQASKQERIDLGTRKKDIGEEIVRLKKNIDMQLGLPFNQAATKGFMQAYQETNGCFDTLIKACRPT